MGWVPGSCQVLDGHGVKKESECVGWHKSVEDGETEITAHQSVVADRWEWPHGGMPRVQPEAVRRVGESLSPPSVAGGGGDRRNPTPLRQNHHHPSFPSSPLLVAFSCTLFLMFQFQLINDEGSTYYAACSDKGGKRGLKTKQRIQNLCIGKKVLRDWGWGPL